MRIMKLAETMFVELNNLKYCIVSVVSSATLSSSLCLVARANPLENVIAVLALPPLQKHMAPRHSHPSPLRIYQYL